MPVKPRLAALLPLLPVLFVAGAAPARADSALASSGPYTLTQSLVDADADYLGWAGGRALTPGEQRQLAAIDVARFRRDPAWTVGALGGEQNVLSSFQTLPAQRQDSLRRTVLNDISHTQYNHLTPDEARRVQQLVAGTDAPADTAARTPVPEAAPAIPAPADVRLPVHDGKFTLTQAMVDDDIAVWQLVAGGALSAADRRAITAVDADLFRRDPAWVTANIRQTHKALPGLRRADAVTLAGLRQNNLVNVFCKPQTQRLTAENAAQLQAVVRRHVPVVGVDAAGQTVVTGADIDAWVAATRYFTVQAHVSGPPPGYRANLVQLARDPATLGSLAEPEVGAMQRNWAAFQRVWPRLSAAQRAQVLGTRLAKMRGAAAQGKGLGLASAVALQVSQDVFGDYGAAQNPRQAQLSQMQMMLMRGALFNQGITQYNTHNMMRGNKDYQRTLSGDGRMPMPTPLPVP